MTKDLVHGDVEERTLEQERHRSSAAGLTASEAVRTTVDTVGRRDDVGSSGRTRRAESTAVHVRNATCFFDSQETPGRIEGITDEAALEAERLARFGY